MPYLDLETGIRMHYRDAGTGRPILFVPGLSATVDTWNYQVLDLADRYRCLCVDLRGHGDSDKPFSSYTYDEMCGDLRAFMGALDLRDVTFVGWSMGAGVGLKYVLDHNGDGRVSRLVMVGAATPRFKQSETEPFGMDEETAKKALEAMRSALPETMTAFSEINFHRQDLDATRRWFLSMWLRMPAYVGYRYFNSLLTEDLRARLGEVRVPVLICHGRHDQVCDPRWAEYMVPRIPACSIVWFEESGHCLMVEEPQKLSQEIASFVG